MRIRRTNNCVLFSVKSLQGLYNHFKNEYFSIIDRIKVVNSSPTSPDASVGEEDDEAQYHQAGYDSYITGSCFQVIRHLAEESSKKSVCNDTRFRNKVFNLKRVCHLCSLLKVSI